MDLRRRRVKVHRGSSTNCVSGTKSYANLADVRTQKWIIHPGFNVILEHSDGGKHSTFCFNRIQR